MEQGEVRYRRFHVIDDGGNLRKGSVTSAIQYEGEEEGSFVYGVQFAYTSPRELHENRKVGQALATMRLMSDHPERGRLRLFMKEKRKGLTQAIKEVIMMEAERKRITWMQGLTEANLV